MSLGVIFDCDGVLIDSEIIYHKVELAVLAALGLEYDPHEFAARFMGMSDKAFHEALEADALARLGRSIIADLRLRLRESYSETITENLTIVSGVIAAVDAVRVPRAVASSSTMSALEYKLQLTGLWNRFVPHVYSAEHVTAGKPAPDLFLHAAQSLGIEPARCLVIEDSANGVCAAKAAGMRVWGFVGGSHNDSQSGEPLRALGAERIIENWHQAAPLLAAL